MGKGLSGLISALLGLAQGSSSDQQCWNASIATKNITLSDNDTHNYFSKIQSLPKFQVSSFMLMLFGMLCLSGMSFTLLQYLPYCQRAKLQNKSLRVIAKGPCQAQTGNGSYEVGPTRNKIQADCLKHSYIQNIKTDLSKLKLEVLLFLTFWTTGCQFAIMPSIMTYSSLPYGNHIFAIATRLYMLASPLASLTALLLPITSALILGMLVLLGTMLVGFHLFLASMSPSPPLQHETSSKALVVSFTLKINMEIKHVKFPIIRIKISYNLKLVSKRIIYK